MAEKMKLVVVIPTYGRPGQVARLVSHLERQTRLPDGVVISAPDATHAGSIGKHEFPVSLVFGRTGLTVQRNAALDQTLNCFDIITFFDDDFIPADDYLAKVESSFREHDDWMVVMGNVLMDGAKTAGLVWENGLRELELATPIRPEEQRIADHVGAYGCNMSIRSTAVGDTRFDERLVLYGWQEDIDFTSQLRRKGRVVGINTIRGVHLGMKAGRVSGERFGYSQIVNPVYLIKKGTVPVSFALPLMVRNVTANLLRSLWPENYIDRRGRLRGNLLAILHVLSGRERPEHILNI